MKRLDSYRLLDLFVMVACTGLTVILVFMISLGYNQIAKYFKEIEKCPYFIAFLPAFASSLFHSIINFLACKKHGHNLIDLSCRVSGKHGTNALYIALGSTVITLVFLILFLTETLYSEEYLYVLASLPVGLFPLAYYLVNEFINISNSPMEGRDKVLRIGLIVLCMLPIAFALATYFPGVIGWSYLGIAFIPLSYAIGDAACMSKEYSDMNEKDDL